MSRRGEKAPAVWGRSRLRRRVVPDTRSRPSPSCRWLSLSTSLELQSSKPPWESGERGKRPTRLQTQRETQTANTNIGGGTQTHAYKQGNNAHTVNTIKYKILNSGAERAAGGRWYGIIQVLDKTAHLVMFKIIASKHVYNFGDLRGISLGAIQCV